MSKPIPQQAIDTLPEGYTILGWGRDFKAIEGQKSCKSFLGGSKSWSDYDYHGTSSAVLYAAPTDSEIVKLNQKGSEVQDGTKAVPIFPEDAEERKKYPVGTLIRDYFPHAIAALARHSYEAQAQHGPTTNGAPMEWLRDKSIGDGNQDIRHFMEGENLSHAWRSLELLERQLTNMEPYNTKD